VRGNAKLQNPMFFVANTEERRAQVHPLRAIQRRANEVLRAMSRDFNTAATQELKEALLGITGIGWVYPRAEIMGKRDSADPVVRAAALSHYPERSGDWIIIPAAFGVVR